MGHCAGACVDEEAADFSCEMGHLAGPEEEDGFEAEWSMGQRAGAVAGAEEMDCEAA